MINSEITKFYVERNVQIACVMIGSVICNFFDIMHGCKFCRHVPSCHSDGTITHGFIPENILAGMQPIFNNTKQCNSPFGFIVMYHTIVNNDHSSWYQYWITFTNGSLCYSCHKFMQLAMLEAAVTIAPCHHSLIGFDICLITLQFQQ